MDVDTCGDCLDVFCGLEMSSIQEIYGKIPKLICLGLCQDSCGPIMASEAETKVIVFKYGNFPSFNQEFRCDALKNNRCSIYHDRPMICRLWGLAEGMECPFGCKPERYVTKQEGFKLLDELDKI